MEIYQLRPSVIKRAIPKKVVGSYRLGILNKKDFDVLYFGRSDKDLQRRLLQHAKEAKFSYFTFEIADTVFHSYRQECRDWHMRMSKSKNCVHPFAPKRLPYICPYCLVKTVLKFRRL